MTLTRGLLRGGLWIKRTPSAYSPEQVTQWLSKVEYPDEISSFVPSLNSLCLLTRLNLTTFPFENTPMHYTVAHSMDITYEGLYQRMVASSEGNGSYCFGLNGLFFQMLKGLGFRVYAGSGRINEQAPGVAPIFHALWTSPPALCALSCSRKAKSLWAHLRLSITPCGLESSPNSQTPEKFEWCLQSVHRNEDVKTTRVMYSFIEDEFFDADYKAFNYSVLGLAAGLFQLTRYLGRVAMAGDAVRRHVGTQTTVLRVMKNEVERAAALREYFGIIIAQDHLQHIRGRGAELKGPIEELDE